MITSTSNPQVRQLAGLQKKSKERSARDVFVVEGIKMFLEAPRDRLVQVCVSESFYRKHQELFPDLSQVMLVSDRVFESVSDTRTPQGVLCVVRQYHYGLADLLGQEPLIMILENLQDPGNLGTILRTGEGAGVTGILLNHGCVDVYNSKVIRSTMGSVYRVPFYYTGQLEVDIQTLKRQGVSVYAAHLRGSVCYDTCDYTRPSGFMVGNESRGLSDELAALADARIHIPMGGQVESLNAAVASSVLLYEANRQRRKM